MNAVPDLEEDKAGLLLHVWLEVNAVPDLEEDKVLSAEAGLLLHVWLEVNGLVEGQQLLRGPPDTAPSAQPPPSQPENQKK